MTTLQHRDVSAEDYLRFSRFLERQCGIVLGDNKQYLVRSRLAPLLREHGMPSVGKLIDKVVSGFDRRLRETVIDAMTTNETLWFRDTYPFELLVQRLLPDLASLNRPIRIWSAACSSGQEPYSIAMAVLEYQQRNTGKLRHGIEIIATDLSADMLSRAEKANYDTLALSRGLSDQRKKQFFQPSEGNSFRLIDDVRRLVRFRSLNLLESYTALGTFDIVFCRNVLIYFSADIKRQILQQIAASLHNDGVLFLGASESLSGLSDAFSMVRCHPGLYYAKK